MKKILILLVIALVGVSCGTSKFSATGEKEKKFVSDFLTMMNKGSAPNYQGMMNCISPAYIKEHGVDVTKSKVDNFMIWGHSIESYQREGLVVARIWGDNREWVHELTFKLSKEKGKIYLVPSDFSDNYLTPWWDRNRYIRE